MYRSINQDEFETARKQIEAVRNLLAIRDRLAEEGRLRDIDSPSKIWKKIVGNYSYALNPTYEIVNTWRFHTYHFTANYIGNALPSYWDSAPPENIVNEYHKLTVELPDYLIARPPRMLGEIGWEINGGLVNEGILSSAQKHIRALYLSGSMRFKIAPRILEIGPGYGGLAYFLWKMLNPSCYYLIDLPESLAFSSVYLGLTTKIKSVIYDGSESHSLGHGEGFFFVPNFLADDLRGRCEFDLIINTGSFGEMTQNQVAHYADLMDSVLADGGIIYEENGSGYESSVIETFSGKFEFLSINRNRQNMRIWAKDRGTLSAMRTFRDYRPSPWRNMREWLPWRLNRIKRKWCRQ